MIDSARQALGQLPLYRRTLAATLRELSKTFPKAIFGITSLSMIGAMLRGAVLAGGLYYLHLLEGAVIVNVRGFEFVARDRFVVVCATLALIALLALSGWFLYAARSITAAMIEGYQAHQMNRIMRMTPIAVTGVRPPRSAEQAAELVARVVVRDAHQSAIVVRFLGRLVPALVTVAYAIPVIIYIDPALTLILSAMLLCALPLFYRSNVMAYESGVISRATRKAASHQLRKWMVSLQHYGLDDVPARDPRDPNFITGHLRKRLSVLPMYLRALARTDFLINILMTLGLGLVLIVQVPGALDGHRNWTSIVAYFVFLRLAVDGVGSTFGFLNIFSKLYPSTRRYQEYVQERRLVPACTGGLELRINEGGLSENHLPRLLLPGTIVALWSRLQPTRFSLPYIVRYECDVRSGIMVNPDDAVIVGQAGLAPRAASIRDILALGPDADLEAFKAIVSPALDRILETRFGPAPDLDRVRSAADWERLPLARRVELGLASAIRGPRVVVIVASTTLSSVTSRERAQILERLRVSGKLVFIVHTERINAAVLERVTSAGYGAACAAVVGACGDLLAYGTPTWLKQNIKEVRSLVALDQQRLRSDLGDKAGGDEDGEWEAE